MRFSRLIFALVVLSGAFTLPSLAAKADKAVLVLDASGSMWGQIEGRTKIEIAREVVGDLLEDWPPAVELGLIAYGHREKANCADIETLAPIGPVAAHQIRARLADLNPKGKTPLTEAVRRAAQELRSEEEKATVILVSAGLETCDADPCAAARELEAAGVDFTVQVVGFDLKEGENAQLQCLADNTGGRFLSAATASELKEAMAETTKLVAKPKEPKTTVVKVQPNIGWVQYVNGTGNINVNDLSGKRVAFGCCRKLQVGAGTYNLVGDGFELRNVEIKAGETFVVDGKS